MMKLAQLDFSVSDPKNAIMKYTTDNTIPGLYSGKDVFYFD